MVTVYTIGFRRKPLAQFVQILHDAGIDAVIDVRLRNTSQLSGYAKRDDLAFLLQEGFCIAYEHHPELAPTDDIYDSFRQDKNWQAYEQNFRPLLTERQAEQIGRDILSRHRSVCLLCSEPTADLCHRRLVAEHWAEQIPDLSIIHL
jgi:uncharacterized protein (DUF488 family)